MPYRYLEDVTTADIAFEATGGNLEELIVAAADATLNVMVENLDAVLARERRRLELTDKDLDLLLVNFLQEIVFHKDAEQLLLRVSSCRLTRTRSCFRVVAEAYGERLDPSRHEQRVDVKGVTLHQFNLERTADGWRVRVILDV